MTDYELIAEDKGEEHVPDVDLDKRSFRAASTPLVHVPGMVRNILTYRAMRLSRESRWKGDAIFFLSALFPTIPAGVLLDLVEDRRKWAVENDTDVVIGPVTTADTDTP